ncbi:MAG: AmmeMemoRadiSam system protein B [bacterium]
MAIHQIGRRQRRFITATLALLLLCACKGEKTSGEPAMQTNIEPKDIRHPAVAGSWYSDNPMTLRRELEGYLERAEDFQLHDVAGLVSPHAGYIYSGAVAAYSYKQIVGNQYDVVVIVTPSHAERFYFASVYGRGGYLTPLGLIPVDVETAQQIARGGDLVKISDQGHRQEHLAQQEHSLEIQLPFLQVALGDFKLVPIVMGDQNDEIVHALAAALANALKGKKALLVASSDLSHFHNYDQANRTDSGFVKLVGDYNAVGLLRALDSHQVEACGGGPVCAVMEACKMLGAESVRVLKYANSGDVPRGDKSRVVGYLAAAFFKTATEQTQHRVSRGDAKPLSLDDKRTLMNIARTTMECVVNGKKVPDFKVPAPDLLQDRGAFVTITKRGQLRGCIGFIVAVKPLYQTVREVAESAALRDPRFQPVKPDELPDLELEISALSVPRVIEDVTEIQVGVHGIIMRQGYRQGLLLPQVATDYGWDRQTFLEHTCQKAGLPPDAWKDKKTEIQIFSAEVFDEEEIK